MFSKQHFRRQLRKTKQANTGQQAVRQHFLSGGFNPDVERQLAG